jgi:PAS domain S-box-containing protein
MKNYTHFTLRVNNIPVLNREIRPVTRQPIDTTEESRIREELRKSNERFTYVAKAVADCIWDWDIETGQVYRSDALMALTGYSAAEIESSLDWWGKKVHPKDRQLAMGKLDTFIKQGHTYCDAEYRFLCADNSYKHFSDKGYIIYKNGRPVRAIGVVHDITEQRKMEAKLLRQKIQKQNAISRAIIATQNQVGNELGKELHDNVNQILASANMLLAFAVNTDSEIKGDCLKKVGDYIQSAIEEIRKVSKSLNTSIVKEIGLTRSIEEIIGTIKLSRQIHVHFECNPKLEKLLSHELQLMIYRIVQEQTNNILKYAEASELCILVKRKRQSLQLTISDNGKGFNYKRVKKGNGFANIRNRVEAFNGELNINTARGKGCTIEVNVPLTKGQDVAD